MSRFVPSFLAQPLSAPSFLKRSNATHGAPIDNNTSTSNGYSGPLPPPRAAPPAPSFAKLAQNNNDNNNNNNNTNTGGSNAKAEATFPNNSANTITADQTQNASSSAAINIITFSGGNKAVADSDVPHHRDGNNASPTVAEASTGWEEKERGGNEVAGAGATMTASGGGGGSVGGMGAAAAAAAAVRPNILAERFKTRLCRNYVTLGACPYEDRCMFAHGDEDVRTYEMNMADGLVTEEAIVIFKAAQVRRAKEAMPPPPAYGACGASDQTATAVAAAAGSPTQATMVMAAPSLWQPQVTAPQYVAVPSPYVLSHHNNNNNGNSNNNNGNNTNAFATPHNINYAAHAYPLAYPNNYPFLATNTAATAPYRGHSGGGGSEEPVYTSVQHSYRPDTDTPFGSEEPLAMMAGGTDKSLRQAATHGHHSSAPPSGTYNLPSGIEGLYRLQQQQQMQQQMQQHPTHSSAGADYTAVGSGRALLGATGSTTAAGLCGSNMAVYGSTVSASATASAAAVGGGGGAHHLPALYPSHLSSSSVVGPSSNSPTTGLRGATSSGGFELGGRLTQPQHQQQQLRPAPADGSPYAYNHYPLYHHNNTNSLLFGASSSPNDVTADEEDEEGRRSGSGRNAAGSTSYHRNLNNNNNITTNTGAQYVSAGVYGGSRPVQEDDDVDAGEDGDDVLPFSYAPVERRQHNGSSYTCAPEADSRSYGATKDNVSVISALLYGSTTTASSPAPAPMRQYGSEGTVTAAPAAGCEGVGVVGDGVGSAQGSRRSQH